MQASGVVNSGSMWIDSLLSGDKWGGALGTGAILSYSFPYTDLDSALWIENYSLTNEPWTLPTSSLTSTQQTAAQQAMQQWSNVANIDFFETAETSTSYGTIRFTLTADQSSLNTWGWSYYPSSYSEVSGDVWLNSPVLLQDWSEGSANFSSLMHELGHALGLKHPFDGNYTLSGGEDTAQYSLMSYTDHPYANYRTVIETPMNYSWEISAVQPQTPMLYDIATMQYLYGANMDYATGDDVYTFDNTTPFFKTIWDAGGNDTISVKNFSESCLIDLRAGTFSSLTILSDSLPTWSTEQDDRVLYDGTDNLAIAYNVTIENVIGGHGDDVLIGNDVDNVFSGMAGNDTVYGNNGLDTLLRSEAYAECLIEHRGAALAFNVSGLVDGTDVLDGVERIEFTDVGLALDLDGAAGVTAKLLGSVFGVQSVQNSEYAKIGLDLLDGGMSYQDLAALCFQAAGAISHAQIVDLLWLNLVGSAPTTAQAQPYVDMMDQGMSTGDFGVMVADLELNMDNINFLGLSQSGLVFDLA